MSCHPANSEAIRFLSQLDGAEVKASMVKNIYNYIEKLTAKLNELKQSTPESYHTTKM